MGWRSIMRQDRPCGNGGVAAIRKCRPRSAPPGALVQTAHLEPPVTQEERALDGPDRDVERRRAAAQDPEVALPVVGAEAGAARMRRHEPEREEHLPGADVDHPR